MSVTFPELDVHLITALAQLAEDHVLKQDETFAVLDRFGHANSNFDGEQGVYHGGTRFLSRLSLLIDGQRPTMLGSSVRDDNALLTVDLSNPAMSDEAGEIARPHTLHLRRTMFVAGDSLHECLEIFNYGSAMVSAELEYQFDADYNDIFEVRGERRAARGERRTSEIDESRVRLSYEGLDGAVRSTMLDWSLTPDRLTDSAAVFKIQAPAGQHIMLRLAVTCIEDGAKTGPALAFDDALTFIVRSRAGVTGVACGVETSSGQFNDWLNQSTADLAMMITQTPHGPYPYAGVPWYSTIFGRDGIITALQTLWINPDLARGVLSVLAARQASAADANRDAEPGKIIHEVRRGEMAALGEIPFGEYYGTVDATPLFILLAGRYFQRTGDQEFIERLWPNIERALAWIDEHGDRDGDGYVEYGRRSIEGLANQGWKDSFDSIMYGDGRLAEPPIALCEVQGYVYAAKRRAAALASALGHEARSDELCIDAERLATQFDRDFWCEAINMYALALDGEKRACCVRSSNPGHCLFTGIATPARAAIIAESLFGGDMFNGWGVRTLGGSARRYNPMSYHNGSVWPHDNSIIADGLARYGYTRQAMRIMMGLFEASKWYYRRRLPELFCGFERIPGEAPVNYPVACSPQAWASGAAWMLFRSALGVSIDATQARLVFRRPTLPPIVDWIIIRGLRIGEATASVRLERSGESVQVAVLELDGPLDVVVTL